VLRVTQSNRLDELAAALSEALPAADPFARPIVVVSHPLVARWLRYELASRRGVAGALDLPFLEPFLDGALTGDAAAREVGLRGLDRPRLAALVATALADRALLAEPAMAPVRAYLDVDPPDARRVQLAARIAGLLWDYALTRPDWLDAWDDGRDADAGEVDPAMLAWQRRLHDAVLGATGLASTRGGRWALVPRLPQARRRLGLPPPPAAAPVHVIGFSYLARAHVDALTTIAAAREVHVLVASPCAEYWEDVPRRKRDADEPLALVSWGAPGRDTAAMLLGATDGDAADRFVDPEPATARDAWARDVLRRAAPAGPAKLDAGVTVLACPSLARELEIVGSEIWRLLDADPALTARDVAVLIAGDASRYLAQIGPVFDALHRLPFHVVDAPAQAAGRVAEAARLILELPLGRFTRREMLAVMTHPAVLARHPHVEPADWVRWCERLGIAHGADAADHAGTYLDGTDAFHWSQGLGRLALGAFVAGPRAGVDEPVAIGGADLLPEELSPDKEASAATLTLLARSLIADARWLAARSEPLARWGEILAALVDAYLGDVPDPAARARVGEVLRGVAELDLDGRAVPYGEVVELARGRLAALREGRGEPLAHGVLVAPLGAMRPLPAAVTFVVGVGEGAFPAGDVPSPLDLRIARRRGDVSPRDRDRYAFLEAVLAARRVTVSYVARDERTGDPRAPSSVIHELAEMLAPYLGEPDAAAALRALTVSHPLRRWDDAYTAADRDPRLTPSAAPAAARERHAVAVRSSLDDHLRALGRAAPDAARLRELLAAPALVPLRTALRLDLVDRITPPPDDDAPVVLSLATLRRFLEAPVQAWAQVVLRLDALDLDDDGAAREDEPFDVAPRDRTAILREAFALVLGAEVPCDDAYRRVLRRRELAGHAPRGPFGEAAARRDLARLASWHQALWRRGALGGPWTRLAFGRAGVRGAELLPAVALDVAVRGRTRRVEIVGTTDLIGGAARERTLVLVHKDIADEHRLRHALDHLLLAAADVATGAREGLVLGEAPDVRRLAPWRPDEARAHLAILAADLLGGPHAYVLPYATARSALAGPPRRPRRDGVIPELGWGPLERATGLDVPADAAAIARRRLAPILDRIEDLR
jgi:exodeoxyribonuclease V gamma subunit